MQSLLPFHRHDLTAVVSVAVDGQNVDLALPHKLRPDDTWIDTRAENISGMLRNETRPFSASWSSISATATAEAYTTFF
jgi:hypothetical protein